MPNFRRSFLLVTALIALNVFAAAPPRVGEPAPAFTLSDQNGNVVRLSDARGHKVVLVFYRGYW